MVFKIISNPPFNQHLYIQIIDFALNFKNNLAVILQPIVPFTNYLFKRYHSNTLKYKNFYSVNKIQEIETGDNDFNINRDMLLGICIYNNSNIQDNIYMYNETEISIIDKIIKYLSISDKNKFQSHFQNNFIEGVSIRLPFWYGGSFRIISSKYELFIKNSEKENSFYINELTDENQKRNMFNILNSDFYLYLRRLFSKSRRINYTHLPYLHNWNRTYTDKELCDLFNITDEEYNYLKNNFSG